MNKRLHAAILIMIAAIGLIVVTLRFAFAGEKMQLSVPCLRDVCLMEKDVINQLISDHNELIEMKRVRTNRNETGV